jgi:peptidoglycan/LPS O-acetylase OafA/YrhL
LVALFGAPVPTLEATQHALIAAFQGTSIVRAADGSLMEPFAHTWTLSVEWYFYIAWPLVLLLAKGRGVRARNIMWGATIGAVLLYAASLLLNDHWFYFGPVSRSAQLLVGCAVAMLFQTRRDLSANPRLLLAGATLSTALLAAYVVFGPDKSHWFYAWAGFPLATITGALLIFAGRVAPDSAGVRFGLQQPILTFIGRVSYSLYLWHVIPPNVLDRDILPLPLWAMGLLMLGMTAAGTWVTYRWLEKPFLSNRKEALGSTADATRRSVAGSPVR